METANLMFENEFYISNLIAAQWRGELTPEEEMELELWLEASADNRLFFEKLSNETQFRAELQQFRAADKQRVWQKTDAKIKSGQAQNRPVKKLYTSRFRIAVAAAIFIIAGIGLYFYKSGTAPKVNTYVNDVAPGNNKAILTLANGQRISLNEATNGQLAKQSGMVVTKTADGQVVYTVSDKKISAKNEPLLYNSIETPRGGQFRIVLPDGTRIWLNSASSLKFPVAFSNLGSRSVTLKGEGYFEVAKVMRKERGAKNKEQRVPFTVTANRQTVEVLGTHFNINSYEDEPGTKTTLLEGSVRVSSLRDKKSALNPQNASLQNTRSEADADVKVLTPGQQAVLGRSGALSVIHANTEEALAWKNGYFSFNDEDIQSIMRELCRWYNVEVKYEGDISTERFYAKISRFNNISQVLNALQSTKAIHFNVEGRRVTITK